MLTRKVRIGIVLSLVLAFAVTIATTLYGDAPRMAEALAHFHWIYLPLILGLTFFNYFWRYLKWQYYLKRLNVTLHWWKSFLIFMSGLSMAITPGKVGELLKSFLLKRSTGEPISRTSPIIVAERLTDGIALLGLSATGLILYRSGLGLLAVLVVLVAVGIGIIQNRRLSLALLSFGERLPLISRIAHPLRSFYESSYRLLQWRALLLAVLIGLISWAGECGALYFVFVGFGVAPSFDLFIKATFIMAFSSLVGSISGLPGGLGTADGSMLVLTRVLVSTSATVGGAATLLIRLCTLWFGLGLGVIAFLLFRSTEHTGLSIKPGRRLSDDDRDGWEEQTPSTDSMLSLESEATAPAADLQTASASAHIGENSV